MGPSRLAIGRVRQRLSVPFPALIPTERHSSLRWDALTVFGLALVVRILFSILLAGTFDKNEFVYLSLGRAVGNGAMPYRDFAFFHPPGILVLLGMLNPLTALWWPSARVADMLIDSGTAMLVWRVGIHLYDRRAARAAAILYAVNPIVLVAAVRVDQEIVITALGMAGLTLLLVRDSRRTAVLAGACLGAACWVKYPAAVFLPAYLMASPRRAAATMVGFTATAIALFFPVLGEARLLVNETVAWQLIHRYHTPLGTRLEVTGIFWLAISPLAVAAVIMRRTPAWLLLGFATGCAFIFTASAYASYFVPVAPYAALLGAPIAARLPRIPRPAVIGACLLFTWLWAEIVLGPESRQFIPASSFSDVRPIVQLIDRSTARNTPIIANRFEFAYLADRPSLVYYFWDTHYVVRARYLEDHLRAGDIAVLYPYQTLGSFPAGFPRYLNRHYSRIQLRQASVWFVNGSTLARESPRQCIQRCLGALDVGPSRQGAKKG